MKKIYVCSRLAADDRHSMQEHIELTKKYCRKVLNAKQLEESWGLKRDCDYIPIAPHLYFPQFMDDQDESERTRAMSFNLNILSNCDEMWVFEDEDSISEGMQKEIDYANANHIPVGYVAKERLFN